MATKGYDVFMLDPGTADQVSCRVCRATCTVVRNATGATSFAGAVTKTVKVHDLFTCPNSQTVWHVDALRLAEAVNDSPNPRIAAQMRMDLDELIRANRVAQTVH